jgi:glycosyltransferase involved in cell wall biosynthesis
MRIAFDHQIFGWQRFGGVSRYFFELANTISKSGTEGVQCQIVSPLYVNGYLDQADPALKVTGSRAPAIRRTGRFYRALNRMLTPFILERWKPDILHETYYARRSVAPKGSKTVLTVFDMIHELYPEFFPSWDRTRDEKRAAVSRANHIVCISENTRKDLIRLLKVPPDKTSVVHLGFALSSGKITALQPPPRPYLLFVGSRGGYKNFDRLLHAYASRGSLRGSHDLLAFGGGVFNARERALIRRLGLTEDQVRQLGGNDAVLGGLYKQASFFVYPSLYEGFGIPPLEAMSFDCPVICSNTSSMPEVVGDAAIQFNPKDSESIADAMEAVIENPCLQSHLRRLGRRRLEAFSWRQCASQTLTVYRSILS